MTGSGDERLSRGRGGGGGCRQPAVQIAQQSFPILFSEKLNSPPIDRRAPISISDNNTIFFFFFLMDNSKNGLPCLNHHPTPLGQQSQTQWRTNRRRRRPVLPMTMPLSLAGVGGGGSGGLKARGAARAGTCRSPALSPWLRPITMPVRWTGSGCRVRGAASP